MAIELPALPYEKDALAPHISAETIEYHYGKHHQAYVTKLNAAIEGTELADKDLEYIVKNTTGGTFNNAAQVYNHNFYWLCLTPNAAAPSDALAAKISEAFGSVEEFKTKFSDAAAGNFGSGWTWLVKKADGTLAIVNTDDAETPITEEGVTPLLTCDVWEHAYYVDYRNARPEYVKHFWELVNWAHVEAQLAA
ncbi:MAG TPA: superoxide dismutase [Fe] [Gammaproteobacteria bacterium]|nr:superoxide dismutase [Fe] [Chloroflexota bacterium]HBF08742.1 superoxide dismutase [Fe] [Gammaproteobacteria bacterium]HCK91863.1 superoxide dismutase [Fe] [Gammaproteobacteria bacterium]